MKIIHIISSLGNGGAEKLTIELANEMAKEHDVTICSFRDIEDWMIFPKNIKIKVKLITLGKKSGFTPILYLKLLKVLMKENPDIVNIQSSSSIKYLLPLMMLNKNPKYIYTIHNNLKCHKATFDRFEKFNVNCMEFVCISKTIFKEFTSRYGKLKFYHIDNGISVMKKTDKIEEARKEIDCHRIDKKTMIILAVGRIAEQKNYGLLLKVMKCFSKNQLIAIIIGEDRAEGKQLESGLKDIKPDNVYFLGEKSNVVDYISLSDAMIFSSSHEGMPITAIEAMSGGLPIICTPAGGLVDMIKSGINGFIADDFTEEAS